MTYFFFEEDERRTRRSKWDLIDQAETFEDARARQKELRKKEKQDWKVIKVVYAKDPASALRACYTMMGYHEAKKWADKGVDYPY